MSKHARAYRVGIAGPVGSGKTALVDQFGKRLWPGIPTPIDGTGPWRRCTVPRTEYGQGESRGFAELPGGVAKVAEDHTTTF